MLAKSHEGRLVPSGTMHGVTTACYAKDRNWILILEIIAARRCLTASSSLLAQAHAVRSISRTVRKTLGLKTTGINSRLMISTNIGIHRTFSSM